MRIKILKKIWKLRKVYEPNKIIEINDDGKGNPLERFWRNRIKDSKIDGCVEIVKKVIKPKKRINNVN